MKHIWAHICLLLIAWPVTAQIVNKGMIHFLLKKMVFVEVNLGWEQRYGVQKIDLGDEPINTVKLKDIDNLSYDSITTWVHEYFTSIQTKLEFEEDINVDYVNYFTVFIDFTGKQYSQLAKILI